MPENQSACREFIVLTDNMMWGDKAWFTVSAPVHPKMGLMGLGCSSVQVTANTDKHDFMGLVIMKRFKGLP